MKLNYDLAVLSCSQIWSTRELEGAAVVGLQQSGVSWPIFGSSGIVDKKLSNLSLNTSRRHLVKFLRCLESKLNSWPPWTSRVASLSGPTLRDDFVLTGGILTSLPLFSDILSSMSM